MHEGSADKIASRLRDLYSVAGPEQARVIGECLSSILDRLLLGRLATDEQLAPIRRFPDIYAGESAKRIDARLCELGIVPDERAYLAPKLKTLLVRGRGAGANRALVTEGVFRAVAVRIARTGATNLRCACCGYHFRRCDLSEPKRKIVEACGLEFSDRIPIQRESDRVKIPSYTELEVDHIVPRTGWGPSDPPNLQFLCRLCNQGKLNFESGYETLSVLAAGAYSLEFSVASRPNRTIFYASMMMNDRRCCCCDVTAESAELTIVPFDEWFTPWTSQVWCYGCSMGE